MTSRRLEDDPVRWRDLPPSNAPASIRDAEKTDREIGDVVRMLAKSPPRDDLRLAQIRHRLDLLRTQGRAKVPLMLRTPLRMAVLLLASVGLGGVATALTGRFLGWRRAVGTMPMPGMDQPKIPASGREPHRWRVAMDAPAKLDLVIGPAGTELTVVEGRARIAPADVTDVTDVAGVTVGAGAAWRPIVPHVIPPSEHGALQAPGSTAAPPPPPSKSPDLKAVRPPVGPGVHRAAERAIALVASPDAEAPLLGPGSLGVPPAMDIGGSPVTPPRFEPGVAPAAQPSAREAKALAPRGVGVSSLGSVPMALRAEPASAVPTPALESWSETAVLMGAFRRLRTAHDPVGALALIDAYDHLSEHRGLSREATLARAEALLALGRKNAALTVLDGLRLSGRSIDRRATLARAELRAARSRRTAEAILDFDLVLETDVDDELGARALCGRAVLRETLGDVGGARADVRDYLKRFPADARRKEMTVMLDRLGG